MVEWGTTTVSESPAGFTFPWQPWTSACTRIFWKRLQPLRQRLRQRLRRRLRQRLRPPSLGRQISVASAARRGGQGPHLERGLERKPREGAIMRQVLISFWRLVGTTFGTDLSGRPRISGGRPVLRHLDTRFALSAEAPDVPCVPTFWTTPYVATLGSAPSWATASSTCSTTSSLG